MSTETKDKILDTAERLFAEFGVEATSLRNVIAEAGVNLAAVHYHFHNKESLLDALLLRKLSAVNAERTAMLDRFERESGGTPAIEQVLEALILPTLHMSARHPQFARLMGRVQPEEVMLRLMVQHFPEVLARFAGALKAAMPELDRSQLMWRMHFAVGTMAHTLRSGPRARFAGVETEPLPPQEISRRLVAFLAGAFRAPVPEDEQ